MSKIELPGCTPEPLMSYLKALGVFRLVAEQKDPGARLFWRGGIAVLETNLDRDGLVRFFLEEYKPTPVVVPWSGGDFFGINPKKQVAAMKEAPTSTAIIEAFLASKTDRLAGYRQTIREVVSTMESCGIATKSAIEGAAGKKTKARFITQLRSRLSDEVVFWIDAAALSEEAGTTFNPLLGSGGGSDGNTHFSDNFMQNLWDCLPDFDSQRKTIPSTRPSVRNALFNELDGNLVKRTGALYDSGAVGGPNATQGLLREFLLNPWDFILALEGCSAFAGGMAKRHGAFSAEAPSFPFIVRMIAVGFASAVIKEYGQQEVWLPLWKKPWTYGEHQTLMREGRAQLGRRPAGTGTEFARAIRTLGVNVGIDEFSRYGVIRGRVGGENYNTAAHLGTYRVGYDETITLLDDIDPWLQKLSRAVRDEDLSQRYRVAISRLDAAIDSACRVLNRDSFINVLREIGKVERTFANSLTIAKKQGIKPISGLSSQWLTQANDDSPEFRLAASIAGIQRSGNVGPLRSFLEEVEVTNFVNWKPGNTSAVWSQQPLAANLAAVFRRRQLEATSNGISGVPLNSQAFARLDHVIDFLHGKTDDEKLADLIWGLLGVEYPNDTGEVVQPKRDVPFEFGVPRLIASNNSFANKNGYWNIGENEANAVHDPDVFHALGSGQANAISDSVTKAARRLKSGGLLVNGYRNSRHAGDRMDVVSTIDPTRLLAGMLFPLSNRDLTRIANTVLYPPDSEE